MTKPEKDLQSLHYTLSGPKVKLKRVWRAVKMWGLHRTLAKVAGRLSLPFPPVFNIRPQTKDFLLVGCGQYGASTASFFIAKEIGNRFLGCYDIDEKQSARVKKAYKYKHATSNYEELIDLKGAKRILIASNHASHTDQAILALNKGLIVHVEKPISVTWEQLARLQKAVVGNEDRFFVGYNRPFSKAICNLRKHLPAGNGPFTIQHFVAGHAIDPAHWYYNPEEGTRICGNVGHWIDLTVHLLSQRSNPDKLQISMTCSDPSLREENFSLSISTDLGDLVSMTFTTRGEPFDGVNETINIQHGALMAKIDDFQVMKVWENDFYKKYRYYPKDVGHRRSVVQMFKDEPTYRRPWSEVYASTLLMLHITDMVREGVSESAFSFSQADAKIMKMANQL